MRWFPALLVFVVLVVGAGCNQDLLDGDSDLVVLNDSPCTLAIWVDGREVFAIDPGSDRILDDLGPGQHILEAVDPRGTVVKRRVIELAQGEDFFWALDDC